MALRARRLRGHPVAFAWRAALPLHAFHAGGSGGAIAGRRHACAATCGSRNGPRGHGRGAAAALGGGGVVALWRPLRLREHGKRGRTCQES